MGEFSLVGVYYMVKNITCTGFRGSLRPPSCGTKGNLTLQCL